MCFIPLYGSRKRDIGTTKAQGASSLENFAEFGLMLIAASPSGLDIHADRSSEGREPHA